MAEVEIVSLGTAAASAVTVTATAAPSAAPDAAVFPKETNGKNIGIGQTELDSECADSNAASNTDLGTSPSQEKSSNSHPHDSEYDTASDLENGEEYDDEEDDVDDSLSDDDDEDETETDDDDEDDDEGLEGHMTSHEKVDADTKKKVDEDRSNPQYIPKRGTFYEHDDRTAEVDEVPAEGEGHDDASCQIVGNGAAAGSKSISAPISSASKTMKKWQPASAVDRWSHDRYDPREQAPKTRSDLVSAYGYDIRTEDAPPKAHRRRRYGKGPSKYNRNWEDESAYLKTNNKERKPPKSSDFPALSEKSRKQRRSPTRRIREEKENHMDRRQRAEGRQDKSERQGQDRSNHPEEYNDRRERVEKGERGHKNTKSKSNFNRQSGQATVGKQAAMEFKQKNRANNQGSGTFNNQSSGSNLSSRLESHRQQIPATHSNQQNVKGSPNVQNFGATKNQQQNALSQQQHPNETFNSKKKHDQGFTSSVQASSQINSPQQQQVGQQLPLSTTPPIHNANRQNTGQLQHKAQIPTSNLSQRLQQVQNRNDPSHVGSVQMHSLASQNQQQQQLLQQQQVGNIMMAGGPQSNQQPLTQSQEQRGPPKRYSSLRRSQHESQHLPDHQQLQQIHMQQQATAPPPTMLMPAEQAMLQANLMQMYHQENMQAQMQALQVSQQPNVPKPPGYAAASAQSQPAGPYSGATAPPATYYVAAPDAYTAATAAQATQAAAAASYAAQQAPPSYLAQQQTAATLAYASSAPNSQQAAAATSPFATGANVGVVPQPSPSQTTPGNYQNYNTVGGTTYFVPPHSQPSSRPVSLPQRRPTNAIPILPPSEKNKSATGTGQQQKSQDTTKEDMKPSSGAAPAIGSAENIDHIIDNMFVQRPAFQPPATNAGATSTTTKSISNEQSSSTSGSENSNASNAPITSSTQDNTHSANEKATNDPNTTVATTTETTGSTTTIESSNNNPISTQE